MSFYDAEKCFKEAMQFTDPKANPAQYDIASGLAAMVAGLRSLESHVHAIENDIQNIRSRLR
jgi:hypothetical protein